MASPTNRIGIRIDKILGKAQKLAQSDVGFFQVDDVLVTAE